MKDQEVERSPLFDDYPDDTPMMEFGGWSMPRDFGGILREHRAVRQSVGVFDLSHMGRLVVTGSHARSELEGLFTRELNTDANRAYYGFFCNERGGCLDDDILYPRSDEEVWMVVNASNRIRIVEWLRDRMFSSTVEDRTGSSVLLAVQGPEGPSTIREMGISNMPEQPFRFHADGGSLLATTGYTGEAGGELWLPVDKGRELFERVREQEWTLCGLGARDTLRLEKGFALHGHELSEEIDPITAGLARFIDWDHEFVGRQSLKQTRDQGSPWKQTGIVTEDRRAPRQDASLRVPGGRSLGRVTSGRFSPCLEKGIGLALVHRNLPRNQDLEVQIRDRWHPVQQVDPPFV